jgi:hypothetical protein
MDRASKNGQFLGVRAAAVVVATAFAVGVIAMSASTTQAVAPATAPAMAADGKGPTGYFPDQFVNQGSEVPEHIEAF